MLRLFSEPLRFFKYILLRIFFVHCLRQKGFMCPLLTELKSKMYVVNIVVLVDFWMSP